MKISSFHPKIINTIPVFISVLIAAVLVWYFHVPALSMPLVLGIIAGGLVDLDNRLTGRLKNMLLPCVPLLLRPSARKSCWVRVCGLCCG